MSSDSETTDQQYFGLSWEDFVHEHCLDTTPVMDKNSAYIALDALARLWPEESQKYLASGSRGLWGVNSLLHTGRVLARCEDLQGFGPVLNRIRQHVRAAVMEATAAAGLAAQGYRPAFEVEVEGKRPDIAVDVQGQRVYIEIVSPTHSEDVRHATMIMNDLIARVLPGTTGIDTELYLGPNWDENEAERILAAVLTTAADGTLIDIGGDAYVIRQPAKSGPSTGVVTARIPPVYADAPALGAFSVQRDENGIRTATIRYSISDDRAARMISQELHHFSKIEINVLVLDVTAVPGGLEAWEPIARRAFQLKRNTRLGAIVLLEQGQAGDPLRTRLRWIVRPNRYAAKPVPLTFLAALEALDEPVEWEK
jgi:hypothetical protein